MNDNQLNIGLTNDEAIVLFEFLGRFNLTEDNSLFEDLAELKVLLDIECILEKELSEPFQENYSEIVELARENVREN